MGKVLRTQADVAKAYSRGLADSGERAPDRAGGAAREPEGERGQFDLLPLVPLQAVAVHLGRGAAKYAPNAWRRGMAFSRCISSATRHLLQFSAGMTDEDHLAAAVCNLLFLMQYSNDIAQGTLPATLDDRYTPPGPA